MNSLAEKYRLVLVIALAVVVPVVWYLLVYGPQRQTEQTLNGEMLAVQEQQQEVTARLALAKELATEKSEVERHWRQLTESLFPADSAELLLSYMNRLAQEYNLTLLDKELGFDPLLTKLAAQSQLGQIEAVTLDLTGRGRYFNIGEFLAALDREVVVAGVETIDLTHRAAADPEVYFDMSLRVYLYTAPWSVG